MQMSKLCLIAIFFTFFRSSAQVTPLRIGDRMPDIYLRSFLNDSAKELKVSSLKDKLIILDFWNVHCSVCIAGMPKLDSIQKKFQSQIQIIAVTHNNAQEVKKVFSNLKFRLPDFPFIVGDTILNSLFPHQGDPLHVWINTQGTVFAITDSYNTNIESVTKFLSGNNFQLPRRWDYGFNTDYSLLSEQNSSLLSFAAFYSAVFRGLEAEYNGSPIRITTNAIQAINSTVLKLYSIAYDEELYGFPVDHFDMIHDSRIIIEAVDKSPFFIPSEEEKMGDWIEQNKFSYELKVPLEKGNEKFTYMRQDLDRYFQYSTSIETRRVKCMALVNAGKRKQKTMIDRTNYSFGEPASTRSSVNRNKSIQLLISQLIYSNYYHMPIIDMTNCENDFDLKLKSKVSDLPSLKKELQEYGFDLVDKEMEIGMLVIKDRKNR